MTDLTSPAALADLIAFVEKMPPIVVRIDLTQDDLDTLHRRAARTSGPLTPFEAVPVRVDPDLPPRTMRAVYSDGTEDVTQR